ncbi:MAG TPA: AbrB/MazE/SpoVT family DNA-binding domain-containing protein, partial [Candidatus Limnocylindrales bacterium]|nr:AbrB/MazE/SpoVT family DNA-binding domain-containing protein [Candidatus Limnocylindrales bacterium]
MALSVKVSTKYQISVPSEVRRRLGIEAGDRLTVAVRDDEIVLRRRPARASERLRGIARGHGWYEPDPVTFVRNLRDEWEEEVRERERRWAAESGSPAGSPPRRHRR